VNALQGLRKPTAIHWRYTPGMSARLAALPRHPPNTQLRLFAQQALSRAAGAPLIGGNSVDLLIDGRANFDAWLAAIRGARSTILFENYIFRDDEVSREFRDALVERCAAGVQVYVIRDWLGCLGQSTARFWKPLIAAGGSVRSFGPPSLANPFGGLSRNHRKVLVVDGESGFISGVCVSARWLGDKDRRIAPWRDTGIALRGPAVREIALAFGDSWARSGTPLAEDFSAFQPHSDDAGEVDVRVVATVPNAAGLYRLDQLIAAMAQRRLWLADAYFVGVAPYVQALAAAARDGVDVRMLVPGTSDLPAIGALSRAGYRTLLQSGVRVFEWNGSMMHAKSAVADGRWARVGSSNLNLASWLGNCEIDLAIENEDFAARMEAQYEADLQNATEIVLRTPRRRWGQRRDHNAVRKAGGSSGRAAAGALRLANSVGAAISNRRVLGPADGGIVLAGSTVLGALGVVALLWPRVLAWPLGALALWLAMQALVRYFIERRAAAIRDDDRCE